MINYKTIVLNEYIIVIIHILTAMDTVKDSPKIFCINFHDTEGGL